MIIMAPMLISCGADSSSKQQLARAGHEDQGGVKEVSLRPYQWREDPRCYVDPRAAPKEAGIASYPAPEALRWRAPRRFAGYLYVTFEGNSFVAAQANEKPEGLGEARYQADVYGGRIKPTLEPKTYWVEFIGREALCNSQRPEDAAFERPWSANLVIIDRMPVERRVR